MATATLPRDLLTPADAADYIGVREQTLAVWRTTGRYALPFVRCGRLIRYQRSDLTAWIESRTATQTS